jgi:hypothetical protein
MKTEIIDEMETGYIPEVGDFFLKISQGMTFGPLLRTRKELVRQNVWDLRSESSKVYDFEGVYRQVFPVEPMQFTMTKPK